MFHKMRQVMKDTMRRRHWGRCWCLRIVPLGQIRLDRCGGVEQSVLTAGSSWHAAGGVHD